ncbi:MAG: PIN domain-containing protein [Anaerolineae bacterium]
MAVLQVPDYERAAAVLRQYNDAHIDLVDALIVAIAERLNIGLILTLIKDISVYSGPSIESPLKSCPSSEVE